MKNKLLVLFVLITTFGYAQTFDWNNGYVVDISNSSGYTNNRAIDEFDPNTLVYYTTPDLVPLNLSNNGQGTTGLSVRNAGVQDYSELIFYPVLDIESIKVYTSGNSSNESWIFKSKDASGNVLNTLTTNVTNTASVVTLNFTNVSKIEISRANGTPSTFGVDDIVFTPYVACTVNIPDANFKSYLVGNTAINTNGDTEIQCSEATAFTGTIDCQVLSISDLTGIEAFTNITELYCNNNTLTNLDISANTALTILDCDNNGLTNLDVSSNIALTHLEFKYNSLTSIDLSNNSALEYLELNNNALTSLDITTNAALKELYCWNNNLTTIDLSNNTLLTRVEFNFNQLSGLDVSNNVALEYLNCNGNQLTSLDVSVNTNLEYLTVYSNQLTHLDLSTNTALESLYCYNNNLTSLDLSTHTSLVVLRCQNNNLSSLNIANGNNTNVWSFVTTGNPNLTCIEVDDVTYSDTNWTVANGFIDAVSSFSTNCGALSEDEFTLNEVSLYPNPTTTVLNIKMNSTLKRATIYSVLGAKVLETTSKTITTSNLQNGMYLIKIEAENGSISTKRFIKK